VPSRPAPRQPVSPNLPASLAPARSPENDLVDDGVYVSLSYENAGLANRSASGADIDQCRFTTVDFGQSVLDRVRAADSVFHGCDFANLRASRGSLVRVAFTGSRMTGMAWADGILREVTFADCRMDMAAFRFTTFKHVVFSDCKLMQADFHEADLREARFERCDLSGAQFLNAQMEGTHLSDCALDGAGGVTSFRGATVSSTDVLGLAYTLANALGIRIED
jgi:uncharacterized protein YjbI with pentapeptide repeats